MSNVVKFPKLKRATPPQNEKELEASMQEVRSRFATETAIEIAFDVFRQMERAGFDINNSDSSRCDLLLISDSIKSAMYRALGMKHPLQDFAQEIVDRHPIETDFKMPMVED